MALQSLMRDLPQAEITTVHLHADGMYARVLKRAAGVLIIGKVHKREHFYVVLKGKVQIEQEVYEAGTIIVSAPGTKRAVLALEDSVCMTVHRTDKHDLDEIEAELIVPDETALFDARNEQKRIAR